MRVFIWQAILGFMLAPQSALPQVPGLGAWQISALNAQSRPAGSYLGIRFTDINAERARILKLGDSRGVEVNAVAEGSPADNGGILPGDVLLTYNGENILGAQQLIRLVQETPADRKIKLQIWREGKEHTTFVLTTSPPASQTDQPDRFQAFSFSTGQGYARPTAIVPKPLLVWREVVLGMEFEELDPQLSEYFGVTGGVLIRAVEKESPAAKSGLKAGDVIIAVSNKPTLSAHDFASCLRKTERTTSLTLVRNHKKLTVAAPTGEQ